MAAAGFCNCVTCGLRGGPRFLSRGLFARIPAGGRDRPTCHVCRSGGGGGFSFSCALIVRRDDLRKSHLAFSGGRTDEGVKSIRSARACAVAAAAAVAGKDVSFRHQFAYFCRFRTLRGAAGGRAHFPPRQRFTLGDRRLIQFCLVRPPPPRRQRFGWAPSPSFLSSRI